MKLYCLGFMFTPDYHNILLLKKTTGINVDMWNGLGGVVDDDESAIAAMAREFEEEALYKTQPDDWRSSLEIFASGKEPAWQVKVYRSVFRGDSLHDVLGETKDGPKRWFFLGELHSTDQKFAPHARAFIHILRDQHLFGDTHTPRLVMKEAR